MTELEHIRDQNAMPLLVMPLSIAILNKDLRTTKGGRFELGFISAFTSSLGLSLIDGISNNPIAIMGMSAAIGGTAESLGGGKFANGAVTGAFIGLFNHGMHQQEKRPKLINVTSDTASQDLINLMEQIEKSNLSGNVEEIIDLSNLKMIEGETNQQFDNSYDGHYTKITVMNTKGNSGIFYQVGYFEYHKYGSVGYGMLSIKGQYDFITLKIYSKNSFNKAYEQIFGD